MSDNDESGAAAPTSRAEARKNQPDSFQSQVRAARDDIEQHLEKARADLEEANERINRRSGRNLLSAIGIGVLIGAAFLVALLFAKWLFLFLAIPAVLLAVHEFGRALQGAGRRFDLIPQFVAALAILLTAFFADHWTHWVTTYAAIAFLIVYRMVAQMLSRDGRTYGDVITDVLDAGLVALYIPFLGSLALVLLQREQGEYWVLTMVGVAVASDIGAWAAGISFGKHPMAPRISPNKTWEGFAGAVVAASVAGLLFGVFLLQLPWWGSVLLGVAILGSATLGDLGESMFKRDLGIKDMSSALPGHGGVLDRLDSILPSTVPALALYFLLFPLAAV